MEPDERVGDERTTVAEKVVVGSAIVYAVGAGLALGSAIGGQPALDSPDWRLVVFVALLWPIAVAWMEVRHLS